MVSILVYFVSRSPIVQEMTRIADLYFDSDAASEMRVWPFPAFRAYTTRRGKSTNVQYARFADDMVILIDAERRSDWLVTAINKRLREEFAKLRVEINEDKSRMVDLKKGESFTFLGFEYRRVLSLQRKWRPYYAPKLKKRTALFEKLREVFRQHVSWPVEIVIAKINPILRGWVNYFRVGHSSICFGVVKRWVEEKVRRHLMRARGRKGFGWTRWSSEWLYDRLGLFNNYQLRSMVRCESRPSTIGHITLGTKQTGAPSAGNPHAGCDVAGAGNGFTVWLLRHSQRKRGATARLDLRNTAPVLDPTGIATGIMRSHRGVIMGVVMGILQY